MASSKKSKSEPPTDDDPGRGYGSPPTSDYGQPQGFGPLPGYGPPGGFGSSSDAPVAMRAEGPARARTGLVVLVAFLVQLVAIAGLGNQAVTDRVSDHVGSVHNALGHNMIVAGLNFSWRFSPRHSPDRGHLWLAQLLLVVAFLVVSTLLIIPAVRGVVTFWRAFFSTWTAVLAAMVVAAIVRGAVTSPSLFIGANSVVAGNNGGSSNRVAFALFGPLGPNQSVVIAGIGFGFVIALIVAIVATATRRTTMVPVTPVPVDVPPAAAQAAPPPYYGDDDSSRTQVIDTGAQPRGYSFDKEPVDQFEGARHAADSHSDAESDSDSATRQFPAVGLGAGGPSASPVLPAEPTQPAAPVPPAEREKPSPTPTATDLPTDPGEQSVADATPEQSGTHSVSVDSINPGSSASPAGRADDAVRQEPDVTTQFPRPVTGGYAAPDSPAGAGQIEEVPGPSEPAESSSADTGSSDVHPADAGTPDPGPDQSSSPSAGIPAEGSPQPSSDETSVSEPDIDSSEPEPDVADPDVSAADSHSPVGSADSVGTDDPDSNAAESATSRPRPPAPETTRFADPPAR